MKSVWNGYVSFGLVSIPVRLYAAVENQAISFRLICSECKSPIRYKRFCEGCKREVPWGEVLKAIEIRKGQFYVFEKEELEKLKPAKADTIDVVEFVDAHQVDPIYIHKHYYCAPQKPKDKAYFLFREVLESTARVAIGRFVMREKEHTCIISAYKDGMLLTTLNYQYEIRDIKRVEELKEPPKLKKEELELAKQLVQKLTTDEFDISEFKDTFAEQLKELIRKKEKGEPVIIKEAKQPKVEKNLIQALKASLK
ncbi:Ku protein [Candidatus Woesearchaeota archaeon]|nr:Ku protein [Candidatus Woesearchaeota archaeon]